jgi:hypothetical protein
MAFRSGLSRGKSHHDHLSAKLASLKLELLEDDDDGGDDDAPVVTGTVGSPLHHTKEGQQLRSPLNGTPAVHRKARHTQQAAEHEVCAQYDCGWV